MAKISVFLVSIEKKQCHETSTVSDAITCPLRSAELAAIVYDENTRV